MFQQSNRRLFHLIRFFLIIQIIESETFKCVKDGFFADKKDCWIYHICVGTAHSVKACKEDLLFNPIKNECDWAMNVNCSQKSPEDTLPATSSSHSLYPPDYVFPNPSSFAGEILNGPKYPSRLPPLSTSIFESLCATVDNDYVAHPTDCKRYAYCANGVAQTKTCSKSLFWSQKDKMCVWPVQSDCLAKNISPGSSRGSVEDNVPTWIVRGTTFDPYILTKAPPAPPSSVHNPYKPSVDCPPTQSWRIPDPYDCSVYHECYHGTDLVSYCPAQLLYNPTSKLCDYAQNVQCKNKCTVKNEGVRFVDLISCCHYYECVSGKLVPQTCPHPNSFDVQTRTCLPYKRVKCDGRRQCLSKCHYLSNYDVGKTLCDFVPSCARHSDGYYLDRTKPNCQSYIQCADNRVVNQSRCPYRQRFNQNIGQCAPAEQVPCNAPIALSSSIYIVFLFLLASIAIL